MGIWKSSRRGGQRRLDWPNERKLAFLEVYDTMKCRVKEAAYRVRRNDPLDVRISVLQAANRALPKAERLPASTLHSQQTHRTARHRGSIQKEGQLKKVSPS